MVAAAAVLLASLFAVAAWRHARRADGGDRLGLALVVAAALIPPAMVTVVVLGAQPRMGDVRLALESLAFDPATLEGRAFSIGGDEAGDAVVVPGMHAGALLISPDEAGGVRLTFRPPEEASAAGVVSLDGGRTFLGAVPLPDGATVRVGERTLTLDGDRLASAGKAGRPLRGRGDAPLFPLTHHDPGAEPRAGRWDFLYRARRGWRPWPRRLELAPLSADVAASAAAPRSVRLAKGDRARLSFHALDFVEPWRLADSDAPPGRAIERRSLALDWSGDRIVLRLDTPERATLEAERLETVFAQSGDQASAEVIFGPDPGALNPNQGVVAFRALGEPVRDQLARRLVLTPGADTYAVSGGGGETLRFGEAFEVGGDVRARIRVSRLDLDWRPYAGLLAIVWASALAALAAGSAWRTGAIAPFIVMGLAEFLLALRLLFAVEGAYVDWRPESVAAAPQALFAVALAPFILTALFAPPAALGRRTALAYGGVAAAMAAFLFLAVGGWDPVGVVLTLAAAGALALRFVRIPPLPAGAASLAERTLTRWSGWLGRLPGRSGLEPEARRASDALILAVLALFVLRIVLALAGIQERFPPPINGAVSLFWTPALLAVAAVGLAQALGAPAATPKSELWRALLLWGAVALVAVATPWLVAGDKGYAIHFLPVALVALLVAVAVSDAGRWRRVALGAPAVLAALLLGAIAAKASFSAPGPSEWAALTDSRSPEAHRLLERYAADEGWRLRMGQALRRDIDAASGSREAEEMAAAFHHMRAYGSTVWGRGLLAMDTPTELLRYHLDDNASVVHLISPHGRVGALALIALLWTAAGICTALAMMGGQKPAASTLVGLLALWSIAGVAAYMVLANLQVTPFTGRNLYLLAPASISDLVEGLTLIGLALWALGPRRPA